MTAAGGMWREFAFHALGTAFLAWLWLTTFFVGNILAIVSLVVVRPVSKVWHESFLDEMARVGWGSIVDYIEHVGRLSPVITGDLEALGKPDHPCHTGNKVVIANHSTAGDPLALFILGHRLRRIGNMRFMVKKILLFFPVLGLAAHFLDFVFLSRKWNQDEADIRRVFRKMIEGTRKRPFWLCLFPEGTRLSEPKLRESQTYAAARRLPVLKHVLIPRVKGLRLALSVLRDNVDAVLDVTIAYSERKTIRDGAGAEAHDEADEAAERRARAASHDGGGKHFLANHVPIRPSLRDLFLRRVTARSWPVHLHVRLIPLADIPSDEVRVLSRVVCIAPLGSSACGRWSAPACCGFPRVRPPLLLA